MVGAAFADSLLTRAVDTDGRHFRQQFMESDEADGAHELRTLCANPGLGLRLNLVDSTCNDVSLFPREIVDFNGSFQCNQQ